MSFIKNLVRLFQQSGELAPGRLLTVMFIANAVAAVLMLPAFAAFLLKTPPDTDAAPAKV